MGKSKVKTNVGEAIQKGDKVEATKACEYNRTSHPLSEKAIKYKYKQQKRRIQEWLQSPANQKLWLERKNKAKEFYRDKWIKENKNKPKQFYIEKGFKNEQEFIDHYEKKINSHIHGIDFSKDIEVLKIPPPNEIYQYQKIKVNEKGEEELVEGKYFTLDKNARPSELGISEEYEVMDTNGKKTILKHQFVPVPMTKCKPVDALSSISRPVKDTWNTSESVPAHGGTNQLFIDKIER